MTAQTHPVFNAPDDPNVKIWRYMDFTKYVSLLDKQALFFSRSDLLNDPHEGANSHANIKIRSKDDFYKDAPQSFFDQISQYTIWLRQWTYVNCWHMNEHESTAMWQLYAKTNEAVALQSTFKKLHDHLPENCHVGKVNYIDYSKDLLPDGNFFYPFVHKRKSFEHEREIRAVTSDWGHHNEKETNPNNGRHININLENLIEKVYIAPTAQAWFVELVERITKKYTFKFTIMPSSLDEKPIF